MINKIFASLLLASFGFGSVHAATVGQGFDVTATVNSKCVTTHATTPALAFGGIDAFGAGSSGTVDITFQCTRSVVPSGVALSANDGVVAGMAYSLTVGGVTTVAGTVATATVGATAATHKYTVSGTVTGGQAGDSTTGTATSQTRTLTITY